MRIQRSTFRQAMAQCKRTKGRASAVVPAMRSVRISAIPQDQDPQLIVFESTDLDTWTRVVVKGSFDGAPEPIVCEFNALEPVLKQIAGTVVCLERHGDRIDVSDGTTPLGTVAAIPSHEWPHPPPSCEEFCEVPIPELLVAIDQVLPCTSQDETRYNLNGIQIENHRGGLKFAATDGHRAGVYCLQGPSIPGLGDDDLIVPRRFWLALRPLLNSMKAKCARVMIGIRGITTLHAKCGGTELTAKLIAGDFPDVNRVLPDGAMQYSLHVDKDHWLRVLRATLPALKGEKKQGYSVLKFTMDSKDADDVWVEGEGVPPQKLIVAHKTQGEHEVRFGMNPKYLIDVLDGVSGDTVEIGVPDPGAKSNGVVLSVMTFKSAEPTAMGLNVVMPVRL